MVNRPSFVPLDPSIERVDRLNYGLFRKVVLHIQAAALSGRLNIFSLSFDVHEPNKGITGTLKNTEEMYKVDIKDTIEVLEKGYHWREIPTTKKQEPDKHTEKVLALKEINKNKEKGVVVKEIDIPKADNQNNNSFILTKSYSIITLTDFDFEDEKFDKKELLKTSLGLNEEMNLGESMIIVLFRGDQDNRWPICGYFTLRNFRQVLHFLAESVIKDQPGHASEYDVAPSKFTNELLAKGMKRNNNVKLPPGCLDNPALTLTINSTPPIEPLVEVDYKNKSFWISSARSQTGAPIQPKKHVNPHPLRWDGQVFRMLYEILQFNITDPVVSTPSVNIAK